METTNHHDHVRAKDIGTFGFWVYLMTDLIMFAALFAVYAVVRGNTFGGPSGSDLFDLPFVLKETIVLLASSFTCGLAMLAAQSGKKSWTLFWFGATFALGSYFLVLELGEFTHLIAIGADWTRSAFLSSYFGLVGTHGLHIAIGLFWIIVAMAYVALRGLTPNGLLKLTRLSLFWHFLDIVWIFIFTIVYLMGVAM